MLIFYDIFFLFILTSVIIAGKYIHVILMFLESGHGTGENIGSRFNSVGTEPILIKF